MKHPNKKLQERQEKILDELPKELRAEQARLFRYGNAAYVYHQQAKNLEPSEQDYNEWLEGLSEPIRSDMEKRGFEDCKGVLSFTRYVMEKSDIGMDRWMKDHLSSDDYREYQRLKD